MRVVGADDQGVGEAGGVDPRPWISFACAMLVQAVKDMQDCRPRYSRDRIDAVTWLASNSAKPWFDASGVDQQYALDGMDWVGHARQVLEAHPGDLSNDQSELLRGGLGHLCEHLCEHP